MLIAWFLDWKRESGSKGRRCKLSIDIIVRYYYKENNYQFFPWSNSHSTDFLILFSKMFLWYARGRGFSPPMLNHGPSHTTVLLYIICEKSERKSSLNAAHRCTGFLQYLDPPVAGGPVIDPDGTVGEGIAKPAAVHMAQGGHRLHTQWQGGIRFSVSSRSHLLYLIWLN